MAQKCGQDVFQDQYGLLKRNILEIGNLDTILVNLTEFNKLNQTEKS